MDGTLSQGWGRCNLWEVWVMGIFLSRSTRSRDGSCRPVFNGDAKFVPVCLLNLSQSQNRLSFSIRKTFFLLFSPNHCQFFCSALILWERPTVWTHDTLQNVHPPSLRWASTARFFPLPPALLPLVLLTIFTWNVSELLIRTPPPSIPLFSWGHYT